MTMPKQEISSRRASILADAAATSVVATLAVLNSDEREGVDTSQWDPPFGNVSWQDLERRIAHRFLQALSEKYQIVEGSPSVALDRVKTLYEMFADPLLTIIENRVNDREEAMRIAEEVWMGIAEQLYVPGREVRLSLLYGQESVGEPKALPFLESIAESLIAEAQRAQKAMDRIGRRKERADVTALAASLSGYKEGDERFWNAWDSLPAFYRCALYHLLVQGDPVPAAARACGIAEHELSPIARRALQRLYLLWEQ
jgi:hypothetical protein